VTDASSTSFWRSGRWLPIAVFVVVMSVACVLLARWQIDRLDQRRSANGIVEAATVRSAVDAFDLASSGEPVQWRSVSVTGEYSAEDELLVRQRRLSGKTGYFVLTPIDNERGRVWVARGWVPPGPDAVKPPEVTAPPAGDVTVQGFAREFESADDSVRGLPPRQVQRISAEEVVSQAAATSTVTALWIQAESEDPSAADQPLRLPPPEISEGPHLGYAIQWGMFAVMALIGGIVIVRRQREYYAEDVAAAAARPALNDDREP
jgi:cytochrome oxidase assembly protein ShyY1